MNTRLFTVLAVLLFAGLFMVACPGKPPFLDAPPAADDSFVEPSFVEPPFVEPPIEKPPKLEALSEETERQILGDYLFQELGFKPMESGLKITGYFGAYNGSVIFMPNFGGPLGGNGGEQTVIIDDISFYYPNSHTLKVWNEGLVYELDEAYNLGFLTTEELETIAYYYYNENELFGQQPWQSSPWSRERPIRSLSEETQRRILEAYANLMSEVTGSPTGWYGSEIIRYCGTYNGSIAFIINFGYLAAGYSDIIDGIFFYFPNPPTLPDLTNSILVWKEGRVYKLREAYNLGFLTREDLETIAFYHHKDGIL